MEFTTSPGGWWVGWWVGAGLYEKGAKPASTKIGVKVSEFGNDNILLARIQKPQSINQSMCNCKS